MRICRTIQLFAIFIVLVYAFPVLTQAKSWKWGLHQDLCFLEVLVRKSLERLFVSTQVYDFQVLVLMVSLCSRESLTVLRTILPDFLRYIAMKALNLKHNVCKPHENLINWMKENKHFDYDAHSMFIKTSALIKLIN